jgi:predicted O-methyltransferase YrrM
VSLEQDERKVEQWRRNIADAGLDEWADLVVGDAKETLPVARGRLRSRLPGRVEGRLRAPLRIRAREARPGGVVVADNVTTSDTVQAYAAARQADPTLVSVSVPVGHGLEVTTVLAP